MSADLGARAADPLISDTLLDHSFTPPNSYIPATAHQSIRRKPVPSRHHQVGRQNVQYEPITTYPTAISDESGPVYSGWKLFYLKPAVLITFVLLFLALLAALQLILKVSEKHHGLAATVESRHYLWKYGPTAIVVLLGAFWARVTYQTKVAQPWIDLAKGPSPAERTVLADYVSLWEPTAFVRSVRHRHYLVTITILCSLLFKVLTVLSTALITGQQVSYNRTDVQLEANSLRNDDSDLANIGTIPMLAIAGALNTTAGWPRGTTEDYAFQTFNTTSVAQALYLQAQVDVFAGSLECVLANNTFANWTVFTAYDPSPVDRGHTSEMDFATNDCLLQLRSETHFNVGIDGNESDDLNTTTWRWAQHFPVHCGFSEGADTGRILVTVGELVAQRVAENITQIHNPDLPDGTNLFVGTVGLDVTRSTSFICKPSYNVTVRSVKLDASRNLGNQSSAIISEANAASPHHTLDRVNVWDLTQAIDTALVTASDIGNDNFPAFFPTAENLDVDLALRIGMRLHTSVKPTIDDMFDQNTLRDATERFYRTMTAQIAHTALVDHKLSTIAGSAMVSEYRIVVQSIPAFIMTAILAIMATITVVAMLLLPKKPPAPMNPSTISGFAVVAAESSELMSLTGRNGLVKFSDPASLLSRGLYLSSTSRDSPFSFSIQRQQQFDESRSSENRSPRFDWYQPLMMKRFIQMPLAILVIGIIAGLEVSLWLSRRDNGLGDVDPGSNLKYVWTYVPALTMVLLSIYISGVDVCSKTFAPYHQLKRGCDWAVLRHNLLDQTSFYSILHAVRTSNSAVFTTTLAAILGSFLTIVVNGIYNTEVHPIVTNVQIEVDSWFPYAENLNTGDPGAVIAGLILNANASYPAWTYDTLALAGVEVKSNDTSNSFGLLTASSVVKTKIPALRTRYDCRIYPDSELIVNVTAGSTNSTDPNDTTSVSVVVPAEMFQYTDEDMTSLRTNITTNSYFGMAAGRYPEISDFIFMWGKMGTTDVESVSVAACNSTRHFDRIPFDQVLVDVTLLGPSLQIDEQNPPIPDESTLQSIDHPDLWYVHEKDLGDITPTDRLSSFFSTLVYGRYGVPVEALGSRSNDAMILDAIYRQLQIVQAQQIATYWRRPAINTNLTTLSYEGSLSNQDRTILVQSAIPTHVLVAMLGVVLMLLLVSAIFMDTRRLLPFEPTTIAAMASLLAHSNITNKGMLAKLESEGTAQEKNASQKIVKLGWFDNTGDIVRDRTRRDLGPRWSADSATFTINAIDKTVYQRWRDSTSSRSSLMSWRRPSSGEVVGKKSPQVTTEERYD